MLNAAEKKFYKSLGEQRKENQEIRFCCRCRTSSVPVTEMEAATAKKSDSVAAAGLAPCPSQKWRQLLLATTS